MVAERCVSKSGAVSADPHHTCRYGSSPAAHRLVVPALSFPSDRQPSLYHRSRLASFCVSMWATPLRCPACPQRCRGSNPPAPAKAQGAGRYLAAGGCIAIILLSASAHASAIRAFGELEPGGVAKPLDDGSIITSVRPSADRSLYNIDHPAVGDWRGLSPKALKRGSPTPQELPSGLRFRAWAGSHIGPSVRA